jgi:hypothetical protein
MCLQAIIFSRNEGRLPNPFPELTLGSEAIAYSTCVKNLGIFMDDMLTSRNHVSLVLKMQFCLSRLWHIADITPVETRRWLVQSLAIPLLLYWDVVFSQSSTDVNRRLNIAYNSHVRVMSSASFFVQGANKCSTSHKSKSKCCVIQGVLLVSFWPVCKLSCALAEANFDQKFKFSYKELTLR